MVKYFDNAATTRLDPALLPIIEKYNTEMYYNPSALSRYSTDVAKDIALARENVANLLGAEPSEIIFTSCGTESDNAAMFGALKSFKGNIVTSKVEHAAVYNVATALKSKGIDVRFTKTSSDGTTTPEELAKLIDQDTQYVCLMHSNNETGSINDVKNLCRVAKEINPKCIFICDGVQATGKINVNLKSLGVDFYTCSGHKINAPKGIGVLYCKQGVRFTPYIIGGGQERGLRSGTENVANIMAFSAALSDHISNLDYNTTKYAVFKNTILKIVQQNIDNYIVLTPKNGNPAILTLLFSSIKTEVLLHMLESNGFVFGTGSACSSKNKVNRIISALNIPAEYREGMVRISFDKFTTQKEVDEFASALTDNISKLRQTMGSTR